MFITDRQPQFQAVLETILERSYFQPPSDVGLEYPCIVYSPDPGLSRHADNKLYFYEQRYQVQLLGWEPQPEKFHALLNLPKSTHSHSFVAENLNHDVFSIYF